MAIQTTLNIIKPNAVCKNAIGQIIGAFEKQGLRVAGLRLEHLSRDTCEAFYGEHRGKFFFDRLMEFMTSGPVVLIALTGERAIDRLREIMGATDPEQAAEGTIRAALGDNMTENAVHGSDSPASAEREVRFFFPDLAGVRAASPAEAGCDRPLPDRS